MPFCLRHVVAFPQNFECHMVKDYLPSKPYKQPFASNFNHHRLLVVLKHVETIHTLYIYMYSPQSVVRLLCVHFPKVRSPPLRQVRRAPWKLSCGNEEHIFTRHDPRDCHAYQSVGVVPGESMGRHIFQSHGAFGIGT